MSAYIVIEIEVKDRTALAPYLELARASMQEHGIQLLGKGPTESLEGTCQADMVVVLQAESLEAARTWYSSTTYGKAIAAREGIAKFTTMLVPST